MKLHDFIQKWHQPPHRELKRFSVRTMAQYGSFSPSNPIADFRLSATCQVEINGDYPLVTECLATERLAERDFDDVQAELLDCLDREVTDHVERSSQRRWRKPTTKPVLAIITGAGFSAGFGLPISMNLKDCVTDPCPEPGFSLFDQFSSKYEQAIKEYPLCEFLRAGGKIPDIEHLLTLWSGYREQLRAYDPQRGSQQEFFYRAVIDRVCCHLYARSWSAQMEYAVLFKSLAGWLSKAKQQYDVRFITFNYDTVLELLCKEAAIGFEYLDERATNSADLVIPIRKLHGSINWQRFDDECPSRNEDLLYKGNACHVYVFPEVDWCPYGASREMPVLIPPSAEKTYEELFQIMWSFAAADIKAASKVVIVGYSFPQIDIFARHQLRNLLRVEPMKVRYICDKADSDDLQKLLGLPQSAIVSERWTIEHFDKILDEDP